MTQKSYAKRVEETVARDQKLAFTAVSWLAVLVILLNLTFTNLLVVGAIASLVYLFINGVFLGHVFFEDESFFLELLFGNLLLFVFLGCVSLIVVVVFNLDAVMSVAVLFVVAVFCSFLNRFGSKGLEALRLR